MELIWRIIIGGLCTALGFVMVAKTEWWLNNFGRIEWAERKGVGTRNAYRLLGLLFIFLSFVYITGMWNDFMSAVVSPVTKYNK
jgi:hypothetical protein